MYKQQQHLKMNNYRNQRRDLRRALKNMKIQDSKIDGEKFLDKSLSKSSSKQFNHRTLIVDPHKKSQEFKKKISAYRYSTTAANKPIENENSIVLKPSSTKYMSVQLKDSKFYRLNSRSMEKEKPQRNNTQIVRNRFSSYLTKVPRKNSHNLQRLKTYEIYRPENTRTLTQVINKTNQKLFPGKNRSSQKILAEAQLLFSTGKFKESNNMLEKILEENGSNRKALFLLGMNNLGMKKYLIALTHFNTLLELDATYNKSVFVIASVCYVNLNKLDEALSKINACLSYFPDYFQAHLQKSKVFLKKEDYQEVIYSLRKGLKLQPDHLDGNLMLADAYQKMGQVSTALTIYLKLSKIEQIIKENLQILMKKARCQNKLKKYKQYIASLLQYLKKSSNLSVELFADIHYEIALAYYNLGDLSNALMNAQQVFIEKNIKCSSKALILITIIHILTRNYYEAYHSLLRKDHLGIKTRDLQIYEIFCEGVINLMKRKFTVGLQKLLQLQQRLDDPDLNNFYQIIKEIYPMYLSYAYFCVGKTAESKKQIEISLNSSSPRINIYRLSLQFNLKLCEGLIEYQKQQYIAASQYFQDSIQIYENKPEGYLYLAGTLLKIYLIHPSEQNQSILVQISKILQKCITNLKELNNNYAASAYYFKACFSAFIDQWNQAIAEIDEAIQRSEDNDPQAFYVRALILACCQNYKQAISDISISISINDKQPTYYLLRSRCFQIEGDGNRAFLDLQTYIGLSPHDTEIHKYAGHLLFENGAFEDAIQAYDNGEITKTPENYTVFLTRAKTYFLLGDFFNCRKDMEIALQLTPGDPLLTFDLKIVQILEEFFYIIAESRPSAQPIISADAKAILRQKLDEISPNNSNQGDKKEKMYGKIFRNVEISIIKAMIVFYFGNYRQASRLFKQAIKLKSASILEDDDFDEEEKDQLYFNTQMHYNRALCHLILGEEEIAIKCLDLCQVQEQSKTANKLKQLRKFFTEEQPLHPQISLQIFNQKNKMSKSLNTISIQLQTDRTVKLKMCVPFPKVQPPQISPKFELELLQQIDILKIEKKPEAPWILRQGNSIKFTEKIEKYSQLDLNNSELSKIEQENKNKMMLDNSDSCMESCESEYRKQDAESLQDLKMKLKLDQNIENKLNKLLKKKETK